MNFRFRAISATNLSRGTGPNRPWFITASLVISIFLSLAINGQTRPEPKTGTINGRVLGEDGRAVEGASVDCIPQGGTASRNALTDVEGQFSFTGLSPSPYRLFVSLAGYVAEGGGPDRVVRIGETVTLNLTKGGVITGRVTDANGNPVVAVNVSAQRIKDAAGKPLRGATSSRGRQTDDRGIYRIYGLSEGSYIVVANPGEYRSGMATAYDHDIATYHPSSNREGAAEVMVQAGAEATSIDIRYRDARGHVISGTVDGGPKATSNAFGITVRVISTNGFALMGTGTATPAEDVRVFSINGLMDGEYDIVAGGTALNAGVTEMYGGTSRRVTVRGNDISGLKLSLSPGVSISGKVSIEPSPTRPESCSPSGQSFLTETLIKAQRDERVSEPSPYELLRSRAQIAVNEKNEFSLSNIKSGPYRLFADLPADFWYLKTMTMPAATGTRTVDLGRIALTTREGEKISGVAMVIGEGAAGLSGKLSAARTKRGLWRMHLVPLEIGDADNALAYYESTSNIDGGFTFTNIAPGKYWISARPLPEDETTATQVRPIAWDFTERAKLRREAETAKNVVELKSCQRMKDFVLE